MFKQCFEHWVVVVQELSQEEKRFVRVDKTWMKTMKKAFDTKNVLQVLKLAIKNLRPVIGLLKDSRFSMYCPHQKYIRVYYV